jgi:hypothetical protein
MFKFAQAAMFHGRNKSDSLKWRWFLFPLAYMIFIAFWLYSDPKDLIYHIFHPEKKETRVIKQKSFNEMPSTLTEAEEHPEELTFVTEYIPETTRKS